MMSEIQRVAIVMFCEVETESEMDAGSIASLALRRALSGEPMGRLPVSLSVDAFSQNYPVRIVRALEAGVAIGNGYLWARPTSKAWHA